MSPVTLKTAPKIVAVGSHHLEIGHNYYDSGHTFSKEELYPVLECDVPRAGTVRAQFSADRYVHSSGLSEWRIYARDIRSAPPADADPNAYHGSTPPAAGIGDAARAAINDAGRPIILAWLESDAYKESRRAAATNAARRTIDAPRDYQLDSAATILERIGEELEPERLEEYRHALELLRQAAAILA